MKRKNRVLNTAFLLLLAGVLVCGGVMIHELRKNADMDAAANSMQAEKPEDEDTMDFDALREENPEIIAWLNIPGTDIDYPVLQGEDNKYYLHHDAQKKTNKNGALFLDYRMHADFSDFSSVIFGHYMSSGMMFQNLVKFKEKDFFDTHNEAVLYTPEQTHSMEIFAVAVVPAESDLYNFAFSSPSEQAAHLQLLKENTKYQREIDLALGDRLVLLSTCSYEFTEARTIVACKLPA